MMRIVKFIQLCILTVNSQSILSQIVSADAKEVSLLRQFVTDEPGS